MVRNTHVEAARALHVHEERVGCLHKALKLVTTLLKLTRWVQQIDIAHGDVRLHTSLENQNGEGSDPRQVANSIVCLPLQEQAVSSPLGWQRLMVGVARQQSQAGKHPGDVSRCGLSLA